MSHVTEPVATAAATDTPVFAEPDPEEVSLEQRIRNFQALSGEESALRSDLVAQAENLVRIVGSDEELKTIFVEAEASETVVAEFKVEVRQDERRGETKTEESEAGLDWGGEPEKTTDGQVNLAMRLLSQGMRM